MASTLLISFEPTITALHYLMSYKVPESFVKIIQIVSLILILIKYFKVNQFNNSISLLQFGNCVIIQHF